MLEEHWPLMVAFLFAAGLACGMLLLSQFLGPRRPHPIKSEPFECGQEASGTARDRFNVKFYVVAILFLVFDVEAVFMYPWAVVFRDSSLGIGPLLPGELIIEMLTFVGIVLVGLTYAWRKGALDWNLKHE